MEETGVVYFIQAEMPDHPLKIGYTAGDARERLAALQTGSPVQLHLIGTVPGSKAFERWFHKQLAEYKVVGEWFKGERVRELAVRAMWAAQDPRIGSDVSLAMRMWYRPG